MLARASRRICTAIDSNSGLRAAAAQSWDNLILAEWIDNETTLPEIAEAESVIDQYRAVYSGAEDDLYKKMADLYTMKEAAKCVELYGSHIDTVTRKHNAMTGPLGNETAIPEGEEKMAFQTLREYVDFVNSFEHDRIQRKVEAQLGRKIVALRQTLSIENFSVHFSPMTADSMVTDLNAPAPPVDNQPKASASAQK